MIHDHRKRMGGRQLPAVRLPLHTTQRDAIADARQYIILKDLVPAGRYWAVLERAGLLERLYTRPVGINYVGSTGWAPRGAMVIATLPISSAARFGLLSRYRKDANVRRAVPTMSKQELCALAGVRI